MKSQTSLRQRMLDFLLREHKIPLILVAIIGIIGSSYVLSSIAQKENREYSEVVQIQNSTNESLGSTLLISGSKTASSKLQFDISNYNGILEYVIDFGDGEVSSVKAPQIIHVYEKEGSYVVQLKAEYGDANFIISEQTIFIGKSLNKNISAVIVDREDSAI